MKQVTDVFNRWLERSWKAGKKEEDKLAKTKARARTCGSEHGERGEEKRGTADEKVGKEAISKVLSYRLMAVQMPSEATDTRCQVRSEKDPKG